MVSGAYHNHDIISQLILQTRMVWSTLDIYQLDSYCYRNTVQKAQQFVSEQCVRPLIDTANTFSGVVMLRHSLWACTTSKLIDSVHSREWEKSTDHCIQFIKMLKESMHIALFRNLHQFSLFHIILIPNMPGSLSNFHLVVYMLLACQTFQNANSWSSWVWYWGEQVRRLCGCYVV